MKNSAAAFRRAVRAATPALALGTAALTAALAACSDTPTGPVTTPTATVSATSRGFHADNLATTLTTSGSALVGTTALLRTVALAAPITRSITLHAAGGDLQIPEAGLTLTIPRGAVGDTTVTITATALAGNAVAYDFQPHGAKFLTQLKLKQALTNTTWAGNTGTLKLGAGYFASESQVNPATGAALLNEVITGTVSGNSYQFYVPHFSGYLVSWGRY